MGPIQFKIDKKIPNSLGRAGTLETPHGPIRTPAFVAVGTKATVKSLTPEQIKETGAQVVLANTYHLYLQPGEKIVKDAGGLGKFMNWGGPTFTDSGGFQAFSLGIAYGNGIGKFIKSDAEPNIEDLLRQGFGESKKAKVTEEGVEFVSVLDGGKHFMSPEDSIRIQQDIGADMIFALDEFTSPHADHAKIKATIERTHRWAERCLEEMKRRKEVKKEICQALFGIVQGGRHEDLRKLSARQISSLDFDGFGIGGTFVKEDMSTAVHWVNEILPEEKPRHLLGVGEPVDLILGVEQGCDTFDCVAPTRMARNGGLYTDTGKINVTNSKFRNDLRPLPFSPQYTFAYLHHLFKAKEMLAATLATIHNLSFLNNLMTQIRNSILEGRFNEFKEDFLRDYQN